MNPTPTGNTANDSYGSACSNNNTSNSENDDDVNNQLEKVETLSQKLERFYDIILEVPKIIGFGVDRICINKSVPNCDELNNNWMNNHCLTNKLKADNYGDWSLTIKMVNTKFFQSRDDFDEKVLCGDEKMDFPDKSFQKISFRKALNLFDVDVWCNMDYYLEHRNELDVDLARHCDLDVELKKDSESSIRLEEELLYKLLCKIFGEHHWKGVNDLKIGHHIECNENTEKQSSSFDKDFYLEEFYYLIADSQSLTATAKRGNYYLLFYYGTS